MNLPDSPEVVIAKLSKGQCPYCDKSDFKLIGSHIKHTHGIPINDIKDSLGIRRDRGFCSPEFSEFKKEMARNMGLGKTEETRTQKGDGRGRKLDKSHTNKRAVHFNHPEVKKRFKELMHSPEMRKITANAAKNRSKEIINAQTERLITANRRHRHKIGEDAFREKQRESSRRGRIARLGTEDGLPDIVYAKLSERFVSMICEDNSRGILQRLANDQDEKVVNIHRRLKTAENRGLLKWTGKPYHPNGELTEKTIKILESEE